MFAYVSVCFNIDCFLLELAPPYMDSPSDKPILMFTYLYSLLQYYRLTNTNMKRLFLGSDHAGFTLKEYLKAHITKTYLSSSAPPFKIQDVGTNSLSSCHYPDYPEIISKVIQPEDRAIVICGTGIGIGISMAKCGVTCATVWNEYLAGECAKLCQAMAMGERAISKETAEKMVEVFLQKWSKGEERERDQSESGEKGKGKRDKRKEEDEEKQKGKH